MNPLDLTRNSFVCADLKAQRSTEPELTVVSEDSSIVPTPKSAIEMSFERPKTFQPFLTPVSPSGLPKDYCLSPPLPTQNIKNLSPNQLTKIYWLLKEISFTLSWSINNNTYQKIISLSSPTPPPQRLATPPSFSSQNSKLLLNNISYENNSYQLQFHLTIQDPNNSWILSTNTFPNLHSSSSSPLPLFNTPIPITLWTKNNINSNLNISNNNEIYHY